MLFPERIPGPGAVQDDGEYAADWPLHLARREQGLDRNVPDPPPLRPGTLHDLYKYHFITKHVYRIILCGGFGH